MALIGDYARLNNQLFAFGQEDELYQRTTVIKGRGILRAARIDLALSIAAVAKRQSGADVDGIEVYADEVTSSSQIVLPDSCSTLVIFARKAFHGQTVDIKHTNKVLQVLVYTLSTAESKLSFTVTSQTIQQIDLNFTAGSAGAKLVVVANNVKQNSLGPARSHFESVSLTDQILSAAEPETFEEANDNLSRLLNYQLLLAATIEDYEPATAFALTTYVVQQSQGIPNALDIFSQASAYVTSRVAGNTGAVTTYVPLLDLSSAQQVLQSRLQSALAFEAAFQNFSAQQNNTKNVTLFANVALQASIDADRTYAVLASITKDRYDAASRALAAAQRNFQALQLTMEAKQNAFKEGVEKWKKKEIGKVVAEAVIGVVAVVGTIAVAVVFPPAGAGAIAEAGAAVPAIGAAAASIAKTVSLIDKIITTLKNLFAKIKPALEHVDKLVTALKDTVTLLTKLNDVNDANHGGQIPSFGLGDDQINVAADWDVFGTQMQYLYEPIKGENIQGAADYFLLMAEMVIRAKAVLAAQTALAVTGDAYILTITQKLASERQTERLRKAIASISGSPRAFQIFKLSLLDRLVAGRAWISLDFKQYLAALDWYSLRRNNVIRVDPMKQIEVFTSDAATLQANAAQTRALLRAQSKRFLLTSADRTIVLADDWLSTLNSSKQLSFSIDVTSPNFSKVGRIRMLGFRLYLNGAQSTGTIALVVRLGPDMLDLSLDASSSTALLTSTRTQAYTIAESSYAFEYSPVDGEVLVDGRMRSLDASTLASPFRRWSVAVADGVDVSAVDDLRLELECEFSLTDV